MPRYSMATTTTTAPRYVVDRYYIGVPGAVLAAGSSLAANVWRLHPVVIEQKVTISSLAVRVTTGASVNGQFRVWKSDSATRKPTGTSIAETNYIGFSTSATNIDCPLASSVTLNPGLYWFGSSVDTSGATLMSFATTSTYWLNLIGGSSLASTFGTTSAPLFYQAVGNVGESIDLSVVAVSPTTSSAFAAIAFKVSAVFA